MERAAVLIGVEKTGNLQRLQAVRTGVDYMQRWTQGQPGMGQRVVTLTDASGGPVLAADIKRQIRAFVDLATVEQLFVYFAGHGVNVKYNEYWLLSGAPDDPQEAVNVQGSVQLARYCGIPHVVLISDACRTAAEGIQAQAVEGSSIFPNAGPGDEPGRVDLFYATMVGRPALEVRDPKAAAAGFQAAYTTALVGGLEGAQPSLVETDREARDEGVGRVRPWPLHRFLKAEVPRRLRGMGVGLETVQMPDAIITSEPEAWLSQIPLAGSHLGAVTRGGGGPGGGGPPAPQPETLLSVSQDALRAALRTHSVPTELLNNAARFPGGRLFAEGLTRSATAPLPGHFETECGFKVSGVPVVEVVSSSLAQAELLSSTEGLVRMSQLVEPAANVLLVFGDGRGALLPAIRNFIATVAYEDGELASVTYEPSENSSRWPAFLQQLREVRNLRGVVAAAARLGVFRLEHKEDAARLVGRMRATKAVDPAMAVYAAYALHERQEISEVADMERYLRQDIEISLFDVAMLAKRPPKGDGPSRHLPSDVFPAVPLLSQGWALRKAHGIELAAALRDVERHVTDSLWTLFDDKGVSRVRAAMAKGEIR